MMYIKYRNINLPQKYEICHTIRQKPITKWDRFFVVNREIDCLTVCS